MDVLTQLIGSVLMHVYTYTYDICVMYMSIYIIFIYIYLHIYVCHIHVIVYIYVIHIYMCMWYIDRYMDTLNLSSKKGWTSQPTRNIVIINWL